MGIKITLPVKNKSFEGRFALNFKRERSDIAKLLEELKKGRSLSDIFTIPVANAIKNTLISRSYIDKSEKITASGENFIEYPYFLEHEEGIYSLALAQSKDPDLYLSIVVSMERKLSTEDSSFDSIAIPSFYAGNEFSFNNSRMEIGVMESAILKSGGKAYVIEKKDSEIVFDISRGIYVTDSECKMGNTLFESVTSYVKETIQKNASQYSLTDDLKVIVSNVDDFSEADLLKGRLSKATVKNVELVDVPLLIQTEANAKKYAYLWLYKQLMDDSYYSLSEMSELVQNEVASHEILSEKAKECLLALTVSKAGFKQYLSASNYQNLDYRLRVIEEYLGVDTITQDQSFSLVHDYPGIRQFLADKVSPAEVEKMYLVMGYAFVKRKDNQIKDCLNALQRSFKDITIVAKKGKSSQEEEPGLRDLIASMGVKIIDKTGLSEYFHDRYIILKKKDGTYSTFLCSTEIGQIFNGVESKGTITPIRNDETVKVGKSLLQLIEE